MTKYQQKSDLPVGRQGNKLAEYLKYYLRHLAKLYSPL